MATGILDGIRIVDCTIGLTGPEATHLLAEVGADVIKVEPPQGDVTRGTPAFATWNRSKRGVVLDLRDADDLAQLDALLATADVFVHGFRPSEARARGLDDASLAERHPHLIVSAVTGYPANHPDAERSGWDILVQARSGAMDEVDGARPGPIFLRFPLPSWATAYLLVHGILARLLLRQRTGEVGPAHTSLYQGMMAVLAMLWNRGEHIPELMQQKMPLPKGSPGPARMMYECGDGLWVQCVTGFYLDPLLIETVAEMGEGYVDVVNSMPTPEQVEVFARAFKRRPRDEWLASFAVNDVPAAPVLHLGALFTDEQVLLNGHLVDVDDPELGRVRQTLAPYRIEPAPEVRGPAPARGGQALDTVLDADRRAAPSAPTRPRGPLEGVKVLDFGMYLAGPFGPMAMADLGAEVIKVESLTGDAMRVPHQETLFVGCQRGKRSISIDLTRPDSRPVLDRLVRWADVVHHNLRMPAARKLGIDYESLRAINPRLVHCHVSSYGALGPKADWPGYDPVAQAVSGWPVVSSPPGAKPMWYRFGMMDHQCAMASVVPTLLALYDRERTGEGRAVTASLVSGAAETNSETMLVLDGERILPIATIDGEQTGLHAGYRIYPTSDEQWVAVAAVGDARMASLRKVVGVDDDSRLPEAFLAGTADELLDALGEAGVPCELVQRAHEQGFFDAETDQPARLAVSYQHPVYGRFEQPGEAWDFGNLELRIDRPPPLIGQHTEEILAMLGYDEASIATLRDNGVVRTS